MVLFAYARPEHLRATLECVRRNGVTQLHVFSDGPKSSEHLPRVRAVRTLLRAIDWCEVRLYERRDNLGLGRSILTGVSTVLRQCDSVLVVEDDLIFVPGTYHYLCAALHQYRNCPQVMSVAGWTHPRVNPCADAPRPYFDGRACCWLWGTWARAWEGMERDARTLLAACRRQGLDVTAYGHDLPFMAEHEAAMNVWAVRWVYHHLLQGGLCLRPPWSLVDHQGWDAQGTHPYAAEVWENRPLRPCPEVPAAWPEPQLHPRCQALWRRAFPGTPSRRSEVAPPCPAP